MNEIRVLLVDDHAVMRSGLRSLLDATPDIAVVGEAADGRKALTLARELKPDIVLMDHTMPGLNGAEATRLIRERCPATRIVILSMHSSSEHVHNALAAGANGYVLKESASTEVIAALRAVHGGRRYLSRKIAALIDGAPRPSRGSSPIESLSARERQVLQLVVEGKSSAEIAAIVHLSPKSVDTYRSRVMRKLDVADVPALVKFAIRHRLTPLD